MVETLDLGILWWREIENWREIEMRREERNERREGDRDSWRGAWFG